MYKMHLNLDELTHSLLFFMGFDNKFKMNPFLENFSQALDNAAVFLRFLSFSRIVVYVLMERQYMSKFALVFYVFLVFGNIFTIFFISYQISLLFTRILQCLNSFLFNKVYLNSPLTSPQGIQNLAQHVCLFFTCLFLKAKSFYLNYCTGPSLPLEMQNEQYIPEAVFHWCP